MRVCVRGEVGHNNIFECHNVYSLAMYFETTFYSLYQNDRHGLDKCKALNKQEKTRQYSLFVSFMCANRSSTVHLQGTSSIGETALLQAAC